MRVEAVESLPARSGDVESSVTDPSIALAIKNFQAGIASEDSLLALLELLHGPGPEGADRPFAFSSDVVLAFKQPELAAQRTLHFRLLEKLVELLTAAGSKETLEAKLCLLIQARDPDSPKTALSVRLTARGDSPEQAILRWGLGLAHLQQALLFTSRHLRQQLKQNGG